MLLIIYMKYNNIPL